MTPEMWGIVTLIVSGTYALLIARQNAALKIKVDAAAQVSNDTKSQLDNNTNLIELAQGQLALARSHGDTLAALAKQQHEDAENYKAERTSWRAGFDDTAKTGLVTVTALVNVRDDLALVREGVTSLPHLIEEGGNATAEKVKTHVNDTVSDQLKAQGEKIDRLLEYVQRLETIINAALPPLVLPPAPPPAADVPAETAPPLEAA